MTYTLVQPGIELIGSPLKALGARYGLLTDSGFHNSIAAHFTISEELNRDCVVMQVWFDSASWTGRQ